MSTEVLIVDVLIVGAGPIGIETGIVLQSEGWRTLVVDAGAVGETILRTFPPRTRFFTSSERLAIRGMTIPSASQEKATGEEYLAFLRTVVTASNFPLRTFTRVAGVSGADGAFRVDVVGVNGENYVIQAEKIVLATGGTDFPRKLGIPGEELPTVHSYLGDPHRFFQRRVAVVGGRNSAAESALRLYRAGAYVVLVHRQPDIHERVKFWIRPEVESLMLEGLIKRVMPARVVAVNPGVIVVHRLDEDRTEQIPVDDVVVQVGFEQDQKLMRNIGVTFDAVTGRPVIDQTTMESNVKGIFVVGTAIAGTQSGFTTFIENCHQHGDRIAAALAGRAAPPAANVRPIPES